MNKRQFKKKIKRAGGRLVPRWFQIQPFYDKPLSEYTTDQLHLFAQCSGRAGMDALLELINRDLDKCCGIPADNGRVPHED